MVTAILTTAQAPLDTENDTGDSFTPDAEEILSYPLVVPDNIKAATAVGGDGFNTSYVRRALHSWSDDDHSLRWRIMSGTTVLAALDSSGTFGMVYTSQASTDQGIFGPSWQAAASYVNTAADQALWNNATLELQQRYARNMGGDGAYYTLDYFQIKLDYDPTVTFVPVGQAVETSSVTGLSRSSPVLRVKLEEPPAPPDRLNHTLIAHVRPVHPTTIRLLQGASLLEEWPLEGQDFARHELDLTTADQITDYSDLHVEVVSGEPVDAPLSDGTQVASIQLVTPGTADTPAQTVAVATAVETDAAPPASVHLRRYVPLGRATSSETAENLLTQSSFLVERARGSAEAARPVAIHLNRYVTVGQATETATATPLSVGTAVEVPAGAAAETGTARAITPSKAVTVSTAVEEDAAPGVSFAKLAVVGQATQTDTARPITQLLPQFVVVGQATETERAGRLGGGAIMRVWDGSAFVEGPVLVYLDGAFVEAVAVKTWDGAAWVEA